MSFNFDVDVIVRNWKLLAQGFLVSVQLFAVALVGSLILGLFVGLGRLSTRRWIYYPVSLYVNVMRNIPLILVIFWIFFVLPLFRGTSVPPFVAATIAFIIFEATYFGEIIRAGFQVSRGPMLAGLATGLTHWQVVRYILIPIGFRRVLPSLVTQSIVLFQDTSLAYVIGLREFVRTAAAIDAREVRSLELYGAVAVIYFIVCLTASRLIHRLEGRTHGGKGRFHGGKGPPHGGKGRPYGEGGRPHSDRGVDEAIQPIHSA